jgi:hypothetical protein
MFTARYELITKYSSGYMFCDGSWVTRRTAKAETWVRSRSSPYEIIDGHIGTRTGFKESDSIFPCQYNPTNAP